MYICLVGVLAGMQTLVDHTMCSPQTQRVSTRITNSALYDVYTIHACTLDKTQPRFLNKHILTSSLQVKLKLLPFQLPIRINIQLENFLN